MEGPLAHGKQSSVQAEKLEGMDVEKILKVIKDIWIIWVMRKMILMKVMMIFWVPKIRKSLPKMKTLFFPLSREGKNEYKCHPI